MPDIFKMMWYAVALPRYFLTAVIKPPQKYYSFYNWSLCFGLIAALAYAKIKLELLGIKLIKFAASFAIKSILRLLRLLSFRRPKPPVMKKFHLETANGYSKATAVDPPTTSSPCSLEYTVPTNTNRHPDNLSVSSEELDDLCLHAHLIDSLAENLENDDSLNPNVRKEQAVSSPLAAMSTSLQNNDLSEYITLLNELRLISPQ